MAKIFFTADTHFHHKNIIKYCDRPFRCVEEMNEEMIKRWNEVVGDEDIIYHLGDFAMGDPIEALKTWSRLKGWIHLIEGSHEKSILRGLQSGYEGARYCKPVQIRDMFTMSFNMPNGEKQWITLCHYAMRIWPRSHYNTWHLYGHSHGKLPGQGKSFDVGVDSHCFTPWSLEDVIKVMKCKPDNFNLVRRKDERAKGNGNSTEERV